MFGLTTIGLVHTLISLVALVSGVWALIRYKEISPDNLLGRTYVSTTMVSAGTGLSIFQHGGFGLPHILSLLTLIALVLGSISASTKWFGKGSRYIQAITYSMSFLFHAVHGITESLTRLPPGAPLLPSADAPEFKPIYGTLMVLFLIGIAFQLRWVHARVRK